MPPTPRAAKAESATPREAALQEIERLQQQVAILQADAEKREADEGKPPEYEHVMAGTGHLEERLARVTGHVSRIPKRGYNTEQKYHFVAHGDVLDTVRPALAAEGVQFRSRITHTEAEPELKPDGTVRATGGGLLWRMWRIEVQFTFRCWHDERLCEQVTEGWPGYAQDYSDKGASKALTSAIKTFLIQQFLVSTGDDPDEPTRDQAQQQGGQGYSRQETRSTDPRDNELRLARRAVMDFNEKLPAGVLGKIAKRVTGNSLVMKIDSTEQLRKVAKAAEGYLARPEDGEKWLAGEAQQQSGEPSPEEAARQEAAGEPDAPPNQTAALMAMPASDGTDPPGGEGADALPHDPVTLPDPASYDPPLSEEELRQHGLGLNPRPSYGSTDDGTPF